MARKKKKNRVPAEVRETSYERADYICEIMNPEAGCGWKATDLHHRQMRSQGGEHTVENLVAVCRNCHLWAHQHPAVAYESGWLVKSTFNPREISFKRRGGFVILNPDGGMGEPKLRPLEVMRGES